MALNAGTTWEVRTTGNQANGGGFYDRNPGTSVDYSQQDSAQLTLTDLATNGAGTGLSSATGGFTAAMAGNIIQISGGTLTAGWYEITAYTDTNNVTIDRTAGASKTGGTGNVGGAFKFGGTLDDGMITALVAGNTIYIKAGEYILGGTISGTVGSSTAMKRFIGYNTVRGDHPTGDNRPLINCGASYYWESKSYEEYSYIRWTGSATQTVITQSHHSRFTECKASNTSGTYNRYAFRDASYGNHWIHCEAISTNGYAFACGAGTHHFACYAHDSRVGFYHAAEHAATIGSIASNCSVYGIYTTIGLVFNNVVYGCNIGISGSTNQTSIVNNIVYSCTTGISNLTSGDQSHYQDYNCLYNNTTDYSACTAGEHDVSTDPKLKDPANGDFTLDTGSSCFDTGIQLDSTVGL